MRLDLSCPECTAVAAAFRAWLLAGGPPILVARTREHLHLSGIVGGPPAWAELRAIITAVLDDSAAHAFAAGIAEGESRAAARTAAAVRDGRRLLEAPDEEAAERAAEAEFFAVEARPDEPIEDALDRAYNARMLPILNHFSLCGAVGPAGHLCTARANHTLPGDRHEDTRRTEHPVFWGRDFAEFRGLPTRPDGT